VTLIHKPSYLQGPLAFVTPENASGLSAVRLQKLLVAYYRILDANPNLPNEASWPLHPFTTLFRAAHPDAGVRFLAIRCYSLQSRMLEGDREALEKELIGDIAKMEVPILFEELPDRQTKHVEACLFVVTESRRVHDSRNCLLDGVHDYYTYEQDEQKHALDFSQLRFAFSRYEMIQH
jgi:midasin